MNAGVAADHNAGTATSPGAAPVLLRIRFRLLAHNAPQPQHGYPNISVDALRMPEVSSESNLISPVTSLCPALTSLRSPRYRTARRDPSGVLLFVRLSGCCSWEVRFPAYLCAG